MEKYCRDGHATDDTMAHADCMLDNEDYRHTLGICVTLITFARLQWLHKRASMLRYTYTACLV